MAIIQTVTTGKGEKRYQVRWWESAGHQRKRTFTRYEEARRYKTQIERQRDVGEYLDPTLGKITLGEWCANYIESEPLAEATKALYSTLARLYLGVENLAPGSRGRVGRPGMPILARRPMNNIRKADIEDILTAMRQAEVGARTIQATHSLLRRLFSSAVERERIARNPVVGIKVEKAQPRERRYLTPDEVALVAKLVPDRDRALVLLLAYRGLRIGEASFLRVKHVDLFRRQVAIVGAAKEVEGRRLEGQRKRDRRGPFICRPSLWTSSFDTGRRCLTLTTPWSTSSERQMEGRFGLQTGAGVSFSQPAFGRASSPRRELTTSGTRRPASRSPQELIRRRSRRCLGIPQSP